MAFRANGGYAFHCIKVVHEFFTTGFGQPVKNFRLARSRFERTDSTRIQVIPPVTRTEQVKMVINGIDIEVERKPIKNLHLAVYPPDGRVHVSAPEEYSEEQIKLFVLKKWVWLVRKRTETKSYTIQGEREYVSGEAHYYKGELYRLKVVRDNTSAHHVEMQGDYIKIYVHERTNKENIADLLWAWYKEQLTPTIEQYVAKWEKILGVKAHGWTIQQMQSSWGKSHKDSGKIMFNLQLAKKPLNCIEYVVAHELTHLIEQNHTDKFRHILGTYLPGWRKIKEQLNEFPL